LKEKAEVLSSFKKHSTTSQLRNCCSKQGVLE
jgi:hypothetical protein